jgi:squalene-hopene/tetraprenyl-beta-curcumene cyclase
MQALLLLLLLSTAAFHPSVQAADPPLPDLKEEIDSSIRWLRSVQDLESGRYGSGVAATAMVLRAFRECPRAYRAVDGPFVRGALSYLASRQDPDGSIADEGASAEQRLAQTRLAAAALSSQADSSTAEVLARALRWLEPHGLSGEGWDAPTKPGSPESARTMARESLSRRDGVHWNGPRGEVIETAEGILVLSRCVEVLDAAQPRSPDKPAVRLPKAEVPDPEDVERAILEGALFLHGASPDGRFDGEPGIASLAIAALAALPQKPAPIQKTIDDGIAWIRSLQQPDGSIHAGRLKSYTTSAAILALSSEGAKHKEAIDRARGFLTTLQADEGEGYSEDDIYYGGIGYGSSERPDLSNLQLALEALSQAGVEKGDPAFRKALTFLQRCQNRSESNDIAISDGSAVIQSGDDGGAGYAPGDSKAGFVTLEDGTKIPRSYGSMTYALLKCYVLAGLPRDDPRLQEAWKWCQENYTLDVNPGFEGSPDARAAYQGLYYYFYTLSRALDALGEDVVTDSQGTPHRWREEMCGRLLAMQHEDGSWVNENSPRWWEGNPVLATAYALLTLSTCTAK